MCLTPTTKRNAGDHVVIETKGPHYGKCLAQLAREIVARDPGPWRGRAGSGQPRIVLFPRDVGILNLYSALRGETSEAATRRFLTGIAVRELMSAAASDHMGRRVLAARLLALLPADDQRAVLNEIGRSQPSVQSALSIVEEAERAGRLRYEHERGDKWWVASIRGMSGAYSQGRTKASARANLIDALRLIEKVRADGDVR